MSGLHDGLLATARQWLHIVLFQGVTQLQQPPVLLQHVTVLVITTSTAPRTSTTCHSPGYYNFNSPPYFSNMSQSWLLQLQQPPVLLQHVTVLVITTSTAPRTSTTCHSPGYYNFNSPPYFYNMSQSWLLQLQQPPVLLQHVTVLVITTSTAPVLLQHVTVLVITTSTAPRTSTMCHSPGYYNFNSPPYFYNMSQSWLLQLQQPPVLLQHVTVLVITTSTAPRTSPTCHSPGYYNFNSPRTSPTCHSPGYYKPSPDRHKYLMCKVEVHLPGCLCISLYVFHSTRLHYWLVKIMSDFHEMLVVKLTSCLFFLPAWNFR